MERATNDRTNEAEQNEMATLAFIEQALAQVNGQDAAVLLTMDGARVATLSYANGLRADRLRPLTETIQAFIASGGRAWLCRGCFDEGSLGQKDLTEEMAVIRPGAVVTGLVGGGHSVDFQPSWFGARVDAHLS